MTIDEAIKHCEEVANGMTTQGDCKECAEDHRQLAEWLRDYKRLLEREPCEDCISRQAILDKIKEVCFSKEWLQFRWHNGSNGQRDFLINYIVQLPPVTPQPKMGQWIGINPMVDTLMCSECGENIVSEEFESLYCPNCGCRMKGEEE